MRSFATYLIYLAVLARAAGWSQDAPPIPAPAWILLALYGVLLFTARPLTRAWAGYPRAYLLVQSALVIGMLYSATRVDIFPMLFFPLSFQAVLYLPVRAGFAWIGMFSLAMAGMLLAGMERQPGIAMLIFSSGANALMGSFALLIQRTERARQHNQRLLSDLQQAYRGLKDFSAQGEALAAAEERQRLVRELHDSLTQTLFSMNLAVQAAQLAAGQDPGQVEGYLRRLQILARSAAAEVQALTGQSPGALPAEEGLGAALRRLAAERQAQDGLAIRLLATGERELPRSVVTNLYHIAQEALNNISKHAGPCQAVITLDLAAFPMRLEIADSGRGFAWPARQPAAGFGLESMAERAREIGWELHVSSVPGQGTRVTAQERAP
jgi:signal transduction histidine kinase